MSSTRVGRMVRGMVVAAAVLAAAALNPVGAVGGGSVVAVPVGASGSTVYMAVTNTSLNATTTSLNLTLSSGSSTLVGSSSVTLGPLSTSVVPVRMSGTLTLAMTVNLSSQLIVGATDSRDPFCF